METAAFYADISPLENDEVFASQLASVPEARRKKVLQMKRPEDKRLSLGVSLLLRRALEINGVSLFSCRFAHTPEGKPYVVDFPVKISLSHSGKFAAVALSENEVGVDIERTEPQQRRLAERFFHTEEISYLAPFDGDEFDRRFTEICRAKGYSIIHQLAVIIILGVIAKTLCITKDILQQFRKAIYPRSTAG